MTGNTTNPDYSILDAFEQPIVRPRTSVLYHCGMVLVAITMVLLVLIYLSLIGLLAYGVFYHAVHHWESMMGFTRSGRGMVIMFLLYITPILVGGVMIFFMFKPIFAGRAPEAQPLALNPAHERLLYAFIEKLADIVGAPSPKRIDLNCDLNASASFRRGLLHMSRNDMVLTIGLPLVANLTAQEFAGVVAHEFGHFTQGMGMRLGYLIGHINIWFARVVYQRDAWDVSLEQWAHEAEDGRVAIIIAFMQLGVWFSRLILRILMHIGFLVSGFLSRQQEYDADAYEIKVAGSEAFEQTLRKLGTLQAAMEVSGKQIQAIWETKHQLPDNLCELLRRTHENLPAPLLQKIDDHLGLDRTGFFDTHPSAADRIRQGRKAADPGIFHDDRPASALFASFDHPARFVTLLHYTEDLGIPIKPDMLLHVETPPPPRPASGAATATATNAYRQYFLDALPLLLPLKLPAPVPSANCESDAAELEQLAAGLHGVAEQLAPITSQYNETLPKLINARAAARLLEAGVPIRAEEFTLADATIEAARAAETEALATQEALRHSTHEVAAAVVHRLQLGLALRLADRGEYGAEPVSPERIREMVANLNAAADVFPRQVEANTSLAVMNRMLAFRDQGGGESPVLSRAIAAQTQMVNSFVAGSSAPPAETQPAGRLRVSLRPQHASDQDMNELRSKIIGWADDYHAKLKELTHIALVAEGVSV